LKLLSIACFLFSLKYAIINIQNIFNIVNLKKYA